MIQDHMSRIIRARGAQGLDPGRVSVHHNHIDTWLWYATSHNHTDTWLWYTTSHNHTDMWLWLWCTGSHPGSRPCAPWPL